ncbi:MAG: (2Fe-2S)-binding protein [Acidimicrobiales bacterium]|nr:(2Fe-2S)-binding protein [Acidimicrobiales bacterium]
MLVCHCRGISEREVRRALAGGASCREDITERCGAGGDCGGCLPLLDELAASAPERTLRVA